MVQEMFVLEFIYWKYAEYICNRFYNIKKKGGINPKMMELNSNNLIKEIFIFYKSFASKDEWEIANLLETRYIWISK